MFSTFTFLLDPDIKGFLSDVKPALLSVLDAEYEKNPFEVCNLSVKTSTSYYVMSLRHQI